MEVYARIAKDVEPKRKLLASSMKEPMKKQEELRKMQMKVKEISDKVLALREKYTESVNIKEGRQECETLELKSERARSLVHGLGGERDLWEVSIGDLETALDTLVGDCVLAAAFLSCCGPFDSEYCVHLSRPAS